MKKRLLVLCIMIIAASCFVLTGCGGSDGGDSAAVEEESAAPVSEYVGTWKATKGIFKDEEVDVSEVLEDDFIIVCNEDGTATISSEDGEEAAKWFDTDEGLRVQGVDTETDMKFKDTEDGNLDISIFGVHLILEKQ